MLDKIKSYALITCAGAAGVLLLIVGYKNKQLSRLRLELLSSVFAAKQREAVKDNFAKGKVARAAYDKYLEARNAYEERHGKL